MELHVNIPEKKKSLIDILNRQAYFLGFLFKKQSKHLNPVIFQKLKSKEKRAWVLKRLKHELVIAEQWELKKIKSSLKRVLLKSLSKNQQYKNVDSDLINKVSQLIAQERLKNPFVEKTFFAGSTLRTIMFANKSVIPKNILDSFQSFQKAVDSSLETVKSEIRLACAILSLFSHFSNVLSYFQVLKCFFGMFVETIAFLSKDKKSYSRKKLANY